MIAAAVCSASAYPPNSSGPCTHSSPVSPARDLAVRLGIGRPELDRADGPSVGLGARARRSRAAPLVVTVGASVEPYVRFTRRRARRLASSTNAARHPAAAARHQPQRRDLLAG